MPRPETGPAASPPPPARALLRRALPALLVAALAADPAAAQAFAGTFADRGMVLTLEPGDGRYRGTLTYDGRSYAVDAAEAGGELHGSFATDTGSFEFRGRLAGGVLEFESNTITYSLRRTAEAPAPSEVPEVREVPEVPALPADEGGTRDPSLAGVWERAGIAADAGTRLPGAAVVELAGDGVYTVLGGAARGRGHWRTADAVLLLRPAGSEAWRPYGRYRLVVDTLLCSFDDGSRQLWFRR